MPQRAYTHDGSILHGPTGSIQWRIQYFLEMGANLLFGKIVAKTARKLKKLDEVVGVRP